MLCEELQALAEQFAVELRALLPLSVEVGSPHLGMSPPQSPPDELKGYPDLPLQIYATFPIWWEALNGKLWEMPFQVAKLRLEQAHEGLVQELASEIMKEFQKERG